MVGFCDGSSYRRSWPSTGAAAAEAVSNGNVLDWWRLCPEAEDEVRLLGQPCTSVAAPSSGLDITLKPGTRIVRAWDRGYLAVQSAAPEAAGQTALPAALNQLLPAVPTLQAANSAASSPRSGVTRRRLVTTPFGSAVALPLGARPTKEAEEESRAFFVAVGNWDMVQQYGEACSTAEEALDKLEERAEDMYFQGRKGEAVYFEFSVEAVTLLQDRTGSNGDTYETTRQRRFSSEIAEADEASIDEVALGGLLQGQIAYDTSRGMYHVRKPHSESGLSPLEDSNGTIGKIPLREQVNSWLTELLWCPMRWRLVTVSPQLQGTRRAFQQGTSKGVLMPMGARNVDVDIQVQARICATCPTGRIAASEEEEEEKENVPERWCNSIAQGLRLIAGLPSNSPMLKVCVLPTDGTSRTASPSRPTSPARPNSASSYGSPRRRRLMTPMPAAAAASAPGRPSRRCQQGAATSMSMELNLTIHRWGFSLPSDTQAKHQSSDHGLWHLDEGQYLDSEAALQLVPGATVELQLTLPPIVAEAARSKKPPLEFLVVLVPVMAAAPTSVQGLMNDALLLERIPAEAGRGIGPGLDVMLPVPIHLNVLQQARVELRAYLSSGGDMEVTTLGRPLPCRIVPAPTPLAVLTSLSASLLRHRMGYQTTLPRAGVESSNLPWNSELTSDAWNFGGVVITNVALEPGVILVCDDMEQPRLQRLVKLRAGTPGLDARPIMAKYQQLPDAPGSPQVLNDVEVGDQRVVVDGIPTLGIACDGSTLAYRIECIRIAHPGPWGMLANPRMLEEQRCLKRRSQRPTRRYSKAPQAKQTLEPEGNFSSMVCNSYLHLVQLNIFANEGRVINIKVPNLRPGRYVFRAQSLHVSGYSAFSQASTPEVLVPCKAEQQRRMKEVVRLMSMGRLAGSAEVLERAAQEAVKTGIDTSNPTLEEAFKQTKHLRETFNRQSFDSWMKSEALLKKLQEQTTLTYRPTLEKALAEATKYGADPSSPIMRKAQHALRHLKQNEQRQQIYFHRKSMRLERCTKTLKDALAAAIHSPRSNHMIKLQAAMFSAEKAGISHDNQLYREARHQCNVGDMASKVEKKSVRFRSIRETSHGEDLANASRQLQRESQRVSIKSDHSPEVSVHSDSEPRSQTESEYTDSDDYSFGSY